jgi:hypothetical protein
MTAAAILARVMPAAPRGVINACYLVIRRRLKHSAGRGKIAFVVYNRESYNTNCH